MMNSQDMEKTTIAMAASRSTEDLFLGILGRYPNTHEQAVAQLHQKESPQTATQDFNWALLNTTEFMFRR